MTDIVLREDNTALAETAAPPPLARTNDLVAWAEEARAAYSIAESLSKTSFVPAPFKGKPGEITAAILTGNEMGLSPMAALRAFDLIQGTPAIRANAMRGVVQSHGHEVWIETATPSKVVARGQRAGSDKVHQSVWTIERAQQLGLTSKDNWRKQPMAMLIARATSEVCRLTASDVLYGVPHSSEELADGAEADAAPATRKVRRRTAAPPPTPAEPEFPQPDASQATEAAPAGEPTADAWDDQLPADDTPGGAA